MTETALQTAKTLIRLLVKGPPGNIDMFGIKTWVLMKMLINRILNGSHFQSDPHPLSRHLGSILGRLGPATKYFNIMYQLIGFYRDYCD